MKPLHLHIEQTPGWRREVLTILSILVAAVVEALILTGIYAHNNMVSGGVTGIAMLFSYAFGVPIWITVAALNVPIMIWGLVKLRFRFVLYSIFAVVSFSVILALTPSFVIPVENRMIATLFGAVVIGVISALPVRMGASMGGMDVVSLILSRRFSFSMGSINIVLNLVIMGALAFVSGLDAALLSIIAMFVSNVAFNFVMQGFNRTKTVFIISEKWDDIAPHVLNEMHRGVTYIPARGAYSGKERTLVYVIVRTVELEKLKRIVRENDPNALFSIIDTREVVGRGFTPMN